MKLIFLLTCTILEVASCRAANDGIAKMKADDFFPSAPVVALAEAAARSRVEEINKLLDQEVDANAAGKDGMTPLLWALLNDSKVGFRSLLQHGAKPNQQVKQGESVMSFAAIHRDPEFLRLALKHGGNPNLVNPHTGKTPIFDSLDHLRFDNISALVDGGADLNFKDRTGTTVLMRAAGINQYQIVYAMLKAGADPTIKNNWGNNLSFALKNNNLDPKHELYQWKLKVVALLKERGVAID